MIAFDDRPEPESPTWLDDEASEAALEDDESSLADVLEGPTAAEQAWTLAPIDRRNIGGEIAQFLADFEASPYVCVACGGKLLRDGDACGECFAREQERRHLEAIEASRLRYVPRRYHWATLEAPELVRRVRDPMAIAAVHLAVQNPAIERMTFWGPAASGKSSLAQAAGRCLAGKRKEIVFVTARALAVARSISPLGEEAEVVHRAMEAGVLIVDDVGLEDPQARGSALLDVIYDRHARGAITVATLAVAPSELAARLGDGVARRLCEGDGSTSLIEVRHGVQGP